MGLVILLALIGVPLIEIAVFIEVGDRIGLWSTLGLIVATAVAGAALLRHQGLTTVTRARSSLDRGELPVQEMLDGVCLVIAGALLLTPGFVTDAAGAVLLVPAFRRLLQAWAIQRLMAGGNLRSSGPWPHGDRDAGVIDGDFSEIIDDAEALPGARPTDAPQNKPGDNR